MINPTAMCDPEDQSYQHVGNIPCGFRAVGPIYKQNIQHSPHPLFVPFSFVFPNPQNTATPKFSLGPPLHTQGVDRTTFPMSVGQDHSGAWQALCSHGLAHKQECSILVFFLQQLASASP